MSPFRGWRVFIDTIMCARFTIRKTQAIAEDLQIDIVEADLSRPRYNVAPTQNIPVCLMRKGQRVLMDARWGLIPTWAKDPATGSKLINARAETLAGKPSFRRAYRCQRCLIPADGFYEWRAAGKSKQPMYIQIEDGAIFTFAGLYEIWQPPGKEPLWTCTLITTAPNELLKSIHDRMPVILPKALYDAWLDPVLTDVAELQKMLQPFDAQKMNAYPVSHHVNKPAHDDERCIALPCSHSTTTISPGSKQGSKDSECISRGLRQRTQVDDVIHVRQTKRQPGT